MVRTKIPFEIIVTYLCIIIFVLAPDFDVDSEVDYKILFWILLLRGVLFVFFFSVAYILYKSLKTVSSCDDSINSFFFSGYSIFKLIIPVYNIYWIFPFFIRLAFLIDIRNGVKIKRNTNFGLTTYFRQISLAIPCLLFSFLYYEFPFHDIIPFLFVLYQSCLLFFFRKNYGCYWLGCTIPALILLMILSAFSYEISALVIISIVTFVTFISLNKDANQPLDNYRQ